MFAWWKARNEVRTPDYTVRLKRRFRECVEVIYSEAGGREFRFGGELVGRSWRQINILLSRELNDVDIERIVPRLAGALTQLHYEFVILRSLGAQAVPQVEQTAAAAKLRELGYEPEVGHGASTVKLIKRPDWKRPGQQQAKDQAPQLMRLVNSVRGKRARIEILAKSHSAIADFI